MNKKQNFGSQLGALMVIIGSAVGLGNIWKFPYMLGNNGGSAFLFVYLLFVFVLGIPLLATEFAVGRASGKNAIDALGKSNFRFFGFLGVITIGLILTFYSTIGGWVMAYMYHYMIGTFHQLNPQEIQIFFTDFIANAYQTVFWQTLFLFFTAIILLAGVQKGLEKSAKIMMPTIFFGLIFLALRSLTLPNAWEGLVFMFQPDFSKINLKIVNSAMGQAFFSLSLGSAVLVTYGSYLKKDQNLLKLARQVAFGDVLIALLAGVAIFPAVFSFGLEVTTGPTLIFITLPYIFDVMPFGSFFGLIFFICIFFAALTSAIGMLESPVAYMIGQHQLNRKNAVIFSVIPIFLIGILMTLSYSFLSDFKIFDKTIFDFTADILDQFTIPLTSMGYTIYALWKMNRKIFLNEFFGMYQHQNTFISQGIIFLLRYIAPVLVGIILTQGIISLLGL